MEKTREGREESSWHQRKDRHASAARAPWAVTAPMAPAQPHGAPLWFLTPSPHPSAIPEPGPQPPSSSAPVSEETCTVSSLQSCGKKKREARLLPEQHLSRQTYMCPCLPLFCPIALTACWQKLCILGMEGHMPQRQPQTCSADQFDSYSIWVELAGKW